MKRAVRTATLFVALGAIITVLLAWEFALLSSLKLDLTLIANTDAGPSHPSWVKPLTLVWPMKVPYDWPKPSLTETAIGRGLRWDYATAAGPPGPDRRDYKMLLVRSGWPFLAMSWSSGSISGADTPTLVSSSSLGVPDWFDAYAREYTQGFNARRRIPLTVEWPGFLADVSAFAISLWLLLRGLRTTRRFIRSRRNQCLDCGYPIGTSSICTECGLPVVSNNRPENLASEVRV